MLSKALLDGTEAPKLKAGRIFGTPANGCRETALWEMSSAIPWKPPSPSLSNGCVVNVTPELSAVARLGCLRGLHHEESVLKTDFS